MACALMKDEVQGDQGGGLHGEDGDASDDGEEPRLEGSRSNCCCNRATTFVTSAIIARSPLRYLPSSLFGETTTGAPLVVKGKVFVGISGGEGLLARAEQSEPLSGSANAMLCLAGRLRQSFNRAQVIHKTCVTGTLVLLILQAQERRRVNGDQDSQSVCEIEDRAAIALNRDRSSRQTLCRLLRGRR